MNEDWNSEFIKQVLNRSPEQLDQFTLAHLRSARRQTLGRYEARSATVPLFAWAGEHIIRPASVLRHRSDYWIGTLLLAASLFSSIAYWQQTMENDTARAKQIARIQ